MLTLFRKALSTLRVLWMTAAGCPDLHGPQKRVRSLFTDFSQCLLSSAHSLMSSSHLGHKLALRALQGPLWTRPKVLGCHGREKLGVGAWRASEKNLGGRTGLGGLQRGKRGLPWLKSRAYLEMRARQRSSRCAYAREGRRGLAARGRGCWLSCGCPS